MHSHSASERSVGYDFLLCARVANHYPTHPFRTVSLGNRVNRSNPPPKLRQRHLQRVGELQSDQRTDVNADRPLGTTCSPATCTRATDYCPSDSSSSRSHGAVFLRAVSNFLKAAALQVVEAKQGNSACISERSLRSRSDPDSMRPLSSARPERTASRIRDLCTISSFPTCRGGRLPQVINLVPNSSFPFPHPSPHKRFSEKGTRVLLYL